MTPVLLTTLVGIVAVLPPTVDHWIAQRWQGAALVAFLTSLFGVVDGGAVGLLSQVANGSSWDVAGGLALTGLISGVGTSIVNYLKARNADGTPKVGAVTGSGIPLAKP